MPALIPAKLLPRNLLVETGPVDHAEWNYRPLVGRIIRRRNDLAARLLGSRRFDRLLEVGYGSGILMPQLASSSREVFGLDQHDRAADVAASLRRFGVSAHLVSGSATAIPFADGVFDAVVGLSVLEFVDDLDAACLEISRVMREDGVFACVTPARSPIADWGLRVLTGASASRDFGDRRSKVLPTLRRHFDVVQLQPCRSLWTAGLKTYDSILLRRRAQGAASTPS